MSSHNAGVLTGQQSFSSMPLRRKSMALRDMMLKDKVCKLLWIGNVCCMYVSKISVYVQVPVEHACKCKSVRRIGVQLDIALITFSCLDVI